MDHNAMPRQRWGDKPYYSLDYYLREHYGEKVYRLALDAGLTCPNRDGTLGQRGCIFCSSQGSGDFAAPASSSITRQIEEARQLILQKRNCRKYIAYFQAFSNTYGPIDYLRQIFQEAMEHPDVVILSVATRPDCLGDDVLALLSELNQRKQVWVELGLQTIHPATSRFIRSGFSLACYGDAVRRLRALDIPVITHVILGLPHETKEQMLETIDYLGQSGIQGVKLHMLHILTDTDLYGYYCAHPFPLPTLGEYCDLIRECLEHLPPDIVIHRLTGDGPKELLAAPLWSSKKRTVLNEIHRHLKETGSYQGKQFPQRKEEDYGRSFNPI